MSSSDPNNSATTHQSSGAITWFCHECNREGLPLRLPDPQCRYCHSSFVEEIDNDNLGNDARLWHMSADPSGPYSNTPDSFQDDSPPIPGTRQSYDQQERNREFESQIGIGNVLDPLLNIFGLQNVPHSPQRNSNQPRFQRASQGRSRFEFNQSSTNPPRNDDRHSRSRLSLSEFLRYGPSGSPPSAHEDHSTTTNQQSDGSSRRNHTESTSQGLPDRAPLNQGTTSPEDASPPLPGRFSGGMYTFTFDSRTPTPVFGFQSAGPPDFTGQSRRSGDDARPDNPQPTQTSLDDESQAGTAPSIHGFFSLLQHALGHTSPAANHTSESRYENNGRPSSVRSDSGMDYGPSPGNSSSERAHSTPRANDTDGPAHPWSDDGHHFHHFHSGAAPTTPAVNLEEGHPLRQFLNLINSLNPQNGTPREGGFNGFIVNGGAGFGFTTNIASGGSQTHPNLGDYVFGETAMQDILNQLMNLAGANGGNDLVPASEAKIKSLKRFKFDSTLMDDDPGECAICKDVFAVEEDCMELPCKHFFHSEDCIKPWLKQSGTCPVCRYSLVNEPSPDNNHATSSDSTSSETARAHQNEEPRESGSDANSSPYSGTGQSRSTNLADVRSGTNSIENRSLSQHEVNQNNYEIESGFDVD